MAGYTRQSLAQILNGEIVSAPPLNAEFNQILAAFNNSTGHKHDGTAAEGPPIDRIADLDQNNLIFVDTSANQINFYVEFSAAPVGQISIQDGAILPFTDNDIDLGSSSFEFKDLYIDGTANIDSLVADTADINAGTIDNTVIGATTPAAGTFTNLTVSTGSTIDFTGATVSNGGTFTTVTISGGSITGITDLAIADGGTGASTASVARTNLGVAIGTNVQAYDAGLQSISGLTTTADQMIYTTSSDTYATASLTSAGRALLDDADASAQRTTLGLGTLATQNANNVAITGGTISGITNLSDIGNALPYTFSTTTTDSDPGSGVLRLNNATQNTATEIYIDDEEANAADVSAFIQLLSGGNNPSSILGTITLRKEFSPESFLQFKVTGVTNAAGYTKLSIINTSSSTANPFSNSDSVFLDIGLAGDKGDPGDVTGPASSTDNAIVRWDGTGGNLVQDSGVVIDDSGRVGIGTSSPDEAVHVVGSVLAGAADLGTVTYSSVDQFIAMGSGVAGILINNTSTTGVGYITFGDGAIAGRIQYDHSNNSMQFLTSNIERLRIDSSGNVGIGTSSPGKTLDVDGQLRIRNGGTSGYALLEYGASLTATNNWHVGSEGDGSFRFYNGTFGAGTERMRIDSSGNVGIGTTSPSALLDVDGTTRLGGAVSVEDNEVTRPKLKDYSETTVVANTGTTYTIDLENGNVFNLTLTGNCTYTFNNPPASGSAGAFTLIQNQDGTGSRTVTWPASVEWAGGSAPTITSTLSSTDVFTFITTDGGTTWYGFTGGQDFS